MKTANRIEWGLTRAGRLRRHAWIAMPFVFTLASLVAILIGGLGGVVDKSMRMFEIDTTSFSIPSSQLVSFLGSRSPGASAIDARQPSPDTGFPDIKLRGSSSKANITSNDLSLFDLYDVGLWGCCYTAHNGTRQCSKPAYNWLEDTLTQTENNVGIIMAVTGNTAVVPSGVTDDIKILTTLARCTQIVFIIACIMLGVQFFLGFWVNCGRNISNVTFLVALVSALTVCAFAALATTIAAVIIRIIQSSASSLWSTGCFRYPLPVCHMDQRSLCYRCRLLLDV